MYAVIRAGGKQYRVAPGDVIEVEKLPQESGAEVQFAEVLAFSGKEGELGKVANAIVTAQVVEQKRGDKVLVFHYKRKKQYKKLQGHRQAYTAVKIPASASTARRTRRNADVSVNDGCGGGHQAVRFPFAALVGVGAGTLVELHLLENRRRSRVLEESGA